MLRADGKRVHLSTFLFYFMVAGFTYWSLLPQVDKTMTLMTTGLLMKMEGEIENDFFPYIFWPGISRLMTCLNQ